MLNFLQTNVDISHLSNFKTQAFTKYFFEIKNFSDVEKLKEIYEFAESEKLPVLIIGGGTNILFAFDVFDGIILKSSLLGYHYDKNSKELMAYANHSIWEIAQELEDKYNQTRWHRFIGLPGSIGGAVFGNAGCFGLETASNFISAEVYDLSLHRRYRLDKKDCEFSYRESIFKKTQNYFIIFAKFNLSKRREKYSSEVDNIKFRTEVQPVGNSCGSFFTNPSKEFSAGKLIEEVGLKGYAYKNAYFSEKHANFLMTKEDLGDYRDLLYLIELAQKKVFEYKGISLVPEVRIIKNKDIL